MYKEENLIVMLSNYDTNYPRIVEFSEVKSKFESEYWIDLKKGRWGKTNGGWVDCKIGSGWGYISHTGMNYPDIFGVFDRTNINHLDSLSFMSSRAREAHYYDD